jgi:hypothetical protein
MRAQLATAEALIAVSAAMFFSAYAMHAYFSYLAETRSSVSLLSYNMAFYDFVHAVYSNATTSECVDSYVSNGSDCIEKIYSTMEGVYGIRNVSLFVAGVGQPAGHARYMRCFPYGPDGEYLLCFSAG